MSTTGGTDAKQTRRRGTELESELRGEFLRPRGSAVQEVVNRAVKRGEFDPARLTPRIINLPFDLFRNEMMMTLQPVPDHVLRQIVDDIFIPSSPPPDQG